jgi:hypothetical protein
MSSKLGLHPQRRCAQQQKPTRIRVSAGVLVGFLEKSSLHVYPGTAVNCVAAAALLFY